MSRIVHIEIDDSALPPPTPEIEQERRVAVFDLLEDGDELRAKLWDNATYFRERMGKLGFELLPGEHAIIPVMLRDPKLAQEMAARLGERGVYVTAFSFPVVPKAQDRIRTQMSAVT